MMGLGKLKLRTKFKSLASVVAKILNGNSNAHFSSAWDFMMGLGKPQRLAKFEFAVFIYYGNIRELVFKRQIRFLIHPLEELGVTHGLRL